MGKTTKQPTSPTAATDEEDPIWGDLLAGFFSISNLVNSSAVVPAHQDAPAPTPKKPARKQAR
jgi:hypothetical protein